MWGSHSSSDRRRSLRYVEQYAQDVVLEQPFPPRRFNTWIVCIRQVAPRTVYGFLAIFALVLFAVLVNQSRSMMDRPINTGIVLFIIFMPIALYVEVLKPVHRWWYGLRYGRYTVARIISVEQRRLRYGDVLAGQWQFMVDNARITAPFLISDFSSGLWVWSLHVGSIVHILVHPTEPHVLAEFGIVDERSPNLHSAATQQLLTELLGHEPSRESSESS